jgi:hypothetical protein
MGVHQRHFHKVDVVKDDDERSLLGDTCQLCIIYPAEDAEEALEGEIDQPVGERRRFVARLLYVRRNRGWGSEWRR